MSLELPAALTLAALLLAGVLLIAALHSWRRRRWLQGGRRGMGGLLLLGLALLAGSVAANLHTYSRLTAERPVAILAFAAAGPDRFEVLLTLPGGDSAVYSLEGDEWQLDARVLTWRGPARLFGLDNLYRLERLSGRWRDPDRERTGPRSVHPLAKTAGLDLWTLAREHGRWLPWVDAVYGSAAYLPLSDGARYAVVLGPSGLLARPLDPAAETAVRSWREQNR